MIEVKNLTKVYPGVLAVDDISFTVEQGEVVGFLGHNGAGKSTTMRILTCYFPPTYGSAKVAGFDVLRESLEVRKRVGYLPETNPLYPEMRVEEYLMFRARIKKVPASDRVARVGGSIERCGLVERRRSIIGTLSKGLKQRVGLADAIVHEPEIVILDEPTQGLDPLQVREVRKLILELGQKRTVMLSTHILSEVEKVCSRVLIIHRGKIVASGAPLDIAQRFTRTGRVRVEARGHGDTMKQALERLASVSRVFWTCKEGMNHFILESDDHTDLRPGVYKLAVEKGWELCELAFERVSLEDAFAELTASTAAAAPAREGASG